jgi:hypothetical protein
MVDVLRGIGEKSTVKLVKCISIIDGSIDVG